MFYQLLEERTSHSHILVEDVKITPDLGKVIATLWNDKGVQQAYAKATDRQLLDCAEYFLSDVDRLAAIGYVPTTQDILHARVKTSGIVEVKFVIKEMIFRLHIVGGQMSNRRKWLSIFDCVHAVAFCVDLTTYQLSNDRCRHSGFKNNQMTASLQLFSNIANSQVFIDAAIILFLTKTDLFQERLNRTPVTIAFPEYTGTQEYNDVIQYISTRFKTVKKKGPKISCHVVCTTDTNNMSFALNSVTDLLIKNYLQDCGIY